MEPIKALTLHQPWASAIAFGMKQYETRPRKTNHRGLLAIHAGKAFNKEGMAMLEGFAWSDHITLPLARRYSPIGEQEFIKGAVVAVCVLSDCLLMDDELIQSIDAQERAMGHWEAGRYAYPLDNIQMLKNPVPAKGQQGIWTWTPTEGDLDGINL